MKSMKPIIPIVLSIGVILPNFSGATDNEAGLSFVSKDGISCVSGGTGEDQQQAMKELRSQYDLQLTFATKGTGEYLANVDLQIQDATGRQIFDTISDGPLLFANLPPGKYLVIATSNGKSKSQPAIISKQHTRDLYFYWDAE